MAVTKRATLTEMNHAIELEGSFSIQADALHYYDDDEIVCTGTIKLSPHRSVEKFEAVLQATVIYSKRSSNKKTKRPIFRIRASLQEIGMDCFSDQRFEVRMKVPMFTPPTIHSKGTFHINQKTVRIDAFVRWSLDLVGFYPQENHLTLPGSHSGRSRSATTTTLDRDFRGNDTNPMEPVPEGLTLNAPASEGGSDNTIAAGTGSDARGENENENENENYSSRRERHAVEAFESAERNATDSTRDAVEDTQRDDAAAMGESGEQEPKLILLARTKISKRSLYEKTAGEVTVEGSSRATIVKQLKGETRKESTVEPDDEASAVAEMGQPEEGDALGAPAEPTTTSEVENVNTHQAFQPATKAELQFLYEKEAKTLASKQSASSSGNNEAGNISLDHPEEQAQADKEREKAAAELDAILQTDYETAADDREDHKKVLIMRATLPQSTTLCNTEPFEVKVTLLNETKSIIARSIEASLVQVNSYFLSGRRLRQSSTIASDKIKLSNIFKSKTLFTHTLNLNPATKRFAKDLTNFASEGYDTAIPAPTASVTGVKGYSLLMVDYKIVITVKVWGGDDIVKSIAVDLESIAMRTGQLQRNLSDSQRLPIQQRGSHVNNNLIGAQEVFDDHNTVDDGFADMTGNTGEDHLHSNASVSDLLTPTPSSALSPAPGRRAAGRTRSNSTSPRVAPPAATLGAGLSQPNTSARQSDQTRLTSTFTAPLRISSPALSAANVPPQYGEIGSKSTKSYGNLERRRYSSVGRRGSISVPDSLNDEGDGSGTRRRSRQGSVGARGIRRLSKAITPLLGIDRASSGNIAIPTEFTRSENDMPRDLQTSNTSLHDLEEGVVHDGKPSPPRKNRGKRGYTVGVLRRLSEAILPPSHVFEKPKGASKASELTPSPNSRRHTSASNTPFDLAKGPGVTGAESARGDCNIEMKINDNSTELTTDDGLPAYSQVVD